MEREQSKLLETGQPYVLPGRLGVVYDGDGWIGVTGGRTWRARRPAILLSPTLTRRPAGSSSLLPDPLRTTDTYKKTCNTVIHIGPVCLSRRLKVRELASQEFGGVDRSERLQYPSDLGSCCGF